MKTIEQKAQRYDEILARAKAEYAKFEGMLPGDVLEVLEDVIHELKESEDDRIRKALIENFKWFCGDYPETTKWGKDDDLLVKDIIAWLEKQGEQKPSIFIPKFRVGDKLVSTKNPRLTYEVLEVGHINELGNPEYKVIIFADGKAITPQDIHYLECQKVDKWGKLIEHKPADKVEPKFNVNNWIVTMADNLYQVTAIIDDKYQLKYGDNYSIQKCSDVDKNARLWDITKDAKDGDVLYSLDSNQPFIYKERNGYEQATAYCGLNIYGKFFVWGTKDCVITLSNYVPATKEQHDTLEKAMADAGYAFDFEKKELKKINSPVLSNSSNIGKNVPAEWSREDEKNLNAALGYIDDEYLRRWLKDVIHVQYDNKNIEWSEEDKKMIERLILSLSRISANTRTDSTSLSYTFYNEINWLKSLKYRVQPKQEWSEECERNIKELLFLVESNYLNSEEPHDRLIDFLESIKSYTYWKPSEEQIKAVKEASCYSSVLSEKTVDNLISLSKQLKKLREE